MVKESEGYAVFGFGIGSRENARPKASSAKEGGSHDASTDPNSWMNVWAHLAVTYDGAHLRLYVDGELVATECAALGDRQRPAEDRLRHPRRPVRRPHRRGTHLRPGPRRSRSRRRPWRPIQTPEGPVAAYSFDEDEGETADDPTGNGHTATLEGAEWTAPAATAAPRIRRREEDLLSIPASPLWTSTKNSRSRPGSVRPTTKTTPPLIDKAKEGSGPGYGSTRSVDQRRPSRRRCEGQDPVHPDESLR